MKIRLVLALAKAAVALGLTVTIVGITGALGADTAVWAIIGNAAVSNNVIIVFFIMFFLGLM
jgi:hypothetical protein